MVWSSPTVAAVAVAMVAEAMDAAEDHETNALLADVDQADAGALAAAVAALCAAVIASRGRRVARRALPRSRGSRSCCARDAEVFGPPEHRESHAW